MFFKHKRNQAKTTRQTLSTEQLEPKAMFNATAFETQICFEDCLGSSDMDTNDIVLQVKNVALDVGPVNQAGDNGCMIVHPTFHGGEDGRMIVHPTFRGGEDGRMIVHPTFRGGSTANPRGSTDLRSENRFVFGAPKNDSGITLHASANPHEGPEGFMKLGDIAQPIIGSADPGGDDIFMPKPNRVGRAYSLEGQAFLTGVNSLAQANQQPSLTNVWTNGSATSMAPRHAAFAMMGR